MGGWEVGRSGTRTIPSCGRATWPRGPDARSMGPSVRPAGRGAGPRGRAARPMGRGVGPAGRSVGPAGRSVGPRGRAARPMGRTGRSRSDRTLFSDEGRCRSRDGGFLGRIRLSGPGWVSGVVVGWPGLAVGLSEWVGVPRCVSGVPSGGRACSTLISTPLKQRGTDDVHSSVISLAYGKMWICRKAPSKAGRSRECKRNPLYPSATASS